MKQFLFEKRQGNIVFQRNILLSLFSVVLTVLLLQSAYLFFQHEKIIILPPETKQSFWVEGNNFSPGYLEEQAVYMAHLLLDVTSSNIFYQGDILLRYVVPEQHSVFKRKILDDHKRLQKDNLSIIFLPHEIEAFPKSLTVHLTGDVCGYVGSKRVTQNRETYRIAFESKQSRLFLKDFNIMKTDKKGDDIYVK